MDITILIWARAIERLLVCLFAGMSLALGWNLFRARILNPQAAEVGGGGWTIKLEHVGPGVFFALFGASILAWGVASPLSIPPAAASPLLDAQNSVGKGAVRKAEQPSSLSYLSDQTLERKRLLQSINTLLQFSQASASTQGSPSKSRALSISRDELAGFRDSVVSAQFGPETMAIYKKSIDRFLKDPGSVNDDESKVIRQLEPLLSGVLVIEARHE